MSKAMKVIDGDIAENGEPKARRKAEIAIAVPPTADIWLQTMKELAPVVGIDGLRELMTMRREEQARLAEREFNVAMSATQAALKVVTRNKKNKQTGSDYADLAAIAAEAMPIIHAHGFGAITSEFESKKQDHLGVALKVIHSGGHSERYEFNIPWDGAGLKGNANKTPTHAYASTLAYGERYAKCKVFGIATKDDDGNSAAVTQQPPAALITEQAKGELAALIKKADVDEQIIKETFNVSDLAELTVEQAKTATKKLNKTIEFKGA